MITDTKMTFPEVVEYTGLKIRKPTTEEIDLVLNFYKEEYEEKEVEITLALKAINDAREELPITAYIIDFPLVNQKLFYFHQVRIGLQEHTMNLQDFVGLVIGVDDNSVDKTPHNHILCYYNYLWIDEENEVSEMNDGINNICLQITEKKK